MAIFDPARVTTKCIHHTGPDGTRCLLVLDLVGRNLGRRDANAVRVAVEKHTLALALGTLGGLNPLAGASAGPESLEESSPAGVGLGAVVVAHDLLDGLAGFVGVVEGDGADIVVEDVSFDDSVEDVTADETEITVDGGSGATGKVPHLRLVVGEGGVGVLEISDSHYPSQFSCLFLFLDGRELTKPVVHPEVRNSIPHKQVEPAISGADIVQNRTGDSETEVTEENELGILGLIQRARGVEVVDAGKVTVVLALATALGLVLVVVVTGNVGEEVHGPAEQLLQDNVGGGEERGLLKQLIQFVGGPANARSILGASLGDEDHVTSDVTGGLVVLSVGNLPREVRNEQSRMADPTDSVVQPLGRRERLVTTLVGQYPDTGTEETLENGVQPPQSKPERIRRHVLGGHKVLEDIEDGGESNHIPGHIGQTFDGGALEAVSRDSIPDLLDGVVGDLELVAIGVDHLALAVLLSIRRHG